MLRTTYVMVVTATALLYLPGFLSDNSRKISTLSSPSVTNLPNGSMDSSSVQGYFVFKWNKVRQSPRPYQDEYCSATCRGEILIRRRCSEMDCFPCSCHRLCEIYGNCCPEDSTHLRKNSSRGSGGVTEATGSSVSDGQTTNEIQSDANQIRVVCDGGQLSIRSCPRGYPEGRVRTRCEESIPVHQLDTSTLRRVHDNRTELVYWNKYCAFCNNVTEPQSWEITVECDHYLRVYHAENLDQLVRLSLGANSSCRIIHQVPGYLDLPPCYDEWFAHNVTDCCNVTGQWLTYDPDIEKACHAQTDIRDRVISRNLSQAVYYRNIFCAMCNMQNYPRHISPCKKQFGAPARISLPFSVSLSLRNERLGNLSPSPSSRCAETGGWQSPHQRCLQLHCAPGKTLRAGNCTTVLSDIRGLGYKFRLILVPDKPFQTNVSTYAKYSPGDLPAALTILKTAYLSRYLTNIQDALSDHIHGLYINIKLVTREPTVSPKYSTEKTNRTVEIKWFAVEICLVSDPAIPRDQFEQQVLGGLLARNVDVTIDRTKPLVLKSHLVPWAQKPYLQCESENPVLTELWNNIMMRCKTPHKHGLTYLSVNTREPVSSELLKNKVEFLVWSPHLFCPFLMFNASEYSIQVNEATLPPARSITLRVHDMTFVFSKAEELDLLSIDEENRLKVCQSLLKAQTSWLHYWQCILTLVCVSASILCLVITLMTYAIFSGLRSVAGKNSMMLSATLMLAQISLLVSSHTTTQGHVCTVIGMSTHLLWLSMFCWCWICCCHMFRVFTSQTRSVQPSTARAQTIYLAQRIIFCLAVPALIVITVVVSSLLTSGHQRIGYGHNSCYLDSAVLVAISMVTPLGLVLLCNCTFFTLTVIKIHQVRKLQTHQNFHSADRQNLYVYIKLSTMTGLFWSIAVVAEATDNDPLRFVAIIFNGLQGVFIFLSYICNKRVLKLYMVAVGLEVHTPVSTMTDKGTLTKIASQINPREEVREGDESRENPSKLPDQVQMESESPGDTCDGKGGVSENVDHCGKDIVKTSEDIVSVGW